MPSKPVLAAAQWGISHVGTAEVVHRQDRRKSISSALGLTKYEGELAGVVESPRAKDQISALLDLVQLQQWESSSSQEGVVLLLASPAPEAVVALATLVEALGGKIPVNVLGPDGGGGWSPLQPPAFDIADSNPHYIGWPDLLGTRLKAPDLVRDFFDAARLAALRAYPQLTANDWSIRLEGLEVGRVGESGGHLDVGKIGKTGNVSAQRGTWIQVHPDGRFEFDATNVQQAAAKVKAFAAAWHLPGGVKQNEHALESRILRGEVGVSVDRRTLEVISPDRSVNWGSQFPTKWGPGGAARYLDALLRDPQRREVPWAIEMKVALGGEGGYYRHAIAQAVLYRHFIQNATALHFWFDQYGLDATKCEAAIVVPEFKQPAWHRRLAGLCDLFGVTLCEPVSKEAAYI